MSFGRQARGRNKANRRSQQPGGQIISHGVVPCIGPRETLRWTGGGLGKLDNLRVGPVLGPSDAFFDMRARCMPKRSHED